jgi:ATP-dependent helicase YprA (DUF1998 family)
MVHHSRQVLLHTHQTSSQGASPPPPQLPSCAIYPVHKLTLHLPLPTPQALFPIQKSVFAPAMDSRDLIGRAKTGSGKTLAFALPVVEGLLAVSAWPLMRPPPCCSLWREPSHPGLLLVLVPMAHARIQGASGPQFKPARQPRCSCPPSSPLHPTPAPPPLQEDREVKPARGRSPRAIILAPTRELANQTAREFETVCPKLKVVSVYGGVSIGGQVSTGPPSVPPLLLTPFPVFCALLSGWSALATPLLGGRCVAPQRSQLRTWTVKT